MSNTKDLIHCINHKSSKKLRKSDKRVIQFLKKLSQFLEKKKHFTKQQEKVFFSKLPEKLRKSNHTIYDLDNHNGYAIQGTGKISKDNHPKWLSTGAEINGTCITTKVAECAYQSRESILSDILQHDVPKQYFVSKQKLEHILKQ